jgi:hypothetical protein
VKIGLKSLEKKNVGQFRHGLPIAMSHSIASEATRLLRVLLEWFDEVPDSGQLIRGSGRASMSLRSSH